jgi:hypothetical protein
MYKKKQENDHLIVRKSGRSKFLVFKLKLSLRCQTPLAGIYQLNQQARLLVPLNRVTPSEQNPRLVFCERILKKKYTTKSTL